MKIALKNVDDDPYRRQFLNEFHVPRELMFLLNSKKTGIKNFIDVGSNIGHFTLVAAMLGLRTFAVEAFAENYILLCKAIYANNFDNVTPYFSAASKEFGTTSLVGVAASAMINGTAGDVPTVPLDPILKIFGHGQPDLVKIDVEGHEIPVLQGLMETIERSKPLIIFESNNWTSREAGGYETLLEEFRKNQFSLYQFNDDGSVSPFDESDVQCVVCTDYIAVRKDSPRNRAFPIIRDVSVDERIAMIEKDLRWDTEAHRWHFRQTVEQVERRYGRHTRLDRLRSQVDGV